MDSSQTRVARPARVIALVVIGLLVIGLAYLGIAPGTDSVSVPDEATAGDLTLEPCTFEAENGGYPADCGTLFVAENPADPQSRLIALPVIRVRSRAANPAEPIFYLEGGPGVSNVDFERASRFVDNRDLVMVGYRGVDGSVRLDCPEVDSAMAHSPQWLTEDAFRAAGDAYRACARRFRQEGVDLAQYGLMQQIDDLEAARAALGYERVNLLSESAGTRTAIIYAWRFPERILRSVMIGVNPPGHYFWDNETTDEQIDRYAELCSQDADCRSRTDDLAATMREVSADMPDRWLFLPIDDGTTRMFSFFGIMESTTKAGLLNGGGAPFTFDAWLSSAEGDPSGLWFLSAFPDLMGEFPWRWGQRAAAARVDAQAVLDYFATTIPSEGEINLGHDATSATWSGGELAVAWPAVVGEEEYREVRTSEVETLLISGELDGSTPPQVATEELLPYLPNGQQVVLPGIGHTASFYREQPEAGTRLVNAYFDSGVVDDSLYTPQSVDFTPDVTFTTMAKQLVAIMAGLALLTVLGLAWMGSWVSRRGGFGAKAGVALRTLTPILFGLGGWFLGALIVLAILPGVALTDAWVVVLSVGVPIGMGLYFAWVNSSWSRDIKVVGIVAAGAGALAGAWLGFIAGGGIMGVLTAMIGAAALGNLAILFLDMGWDRRGRDRFADATSGLAAEPSYQPTEVRAGADPS